MPKMLKLCTLKTLLLLENKSLNTRVSLSYYLFVNNVDRDCKREKKPQTECIFLVSNCQNPRSKKKTKSNKIH